MSGRGRFLVGLAIVLEAVVSTGVASANRWLWPRAAASERRCRAVAAYLDGHAAASDRILVWGNSPEIYFYARRLPATRYLSSNYHTGHVWGAASNRDGAAGDPGARSALAWRRLFEDLRRTPPAFVVDAAGGRLGHMERDPVDQQPELRQWLRTTCHRLADVAEIPVYACGPAHAGGSPPSAPAAPAPRSPVHSTRLPLTRAASL